MLKILMLRKKITDAKAKLEAALRTREELHTREAELEQSVAEANTEEEQAAVNEAVDAFETEQAENDAEVSALEAEVNKLESELEEAEEKARSAGTQRTATERKEGNFIMPNRTRFAEMDMEQRSALVARDDVKEWLQRMRTINAQKRAVNGTDLLIPEVILPLIREEIARTSKLLRFVNLRNVNGIARQQIMGELPEAVWTEMCAKLNELEFGFNLVQVDGYKVGGFFVVCNATLEDSDINLAGEIIAALGGSIAKAIDKAILFGTGIKMPLGIATRLAQTSQPSDWEDTAPAWTDLHTSNVVKIDADGTSGTAFFVALIEALGGVKPKYSTDGLFWAMNHKTHLHIMAKALAFNSNAAIVANTTLFPIIGGTIVEFEDDEMADNEIIGGYGGNYLLAQRAGIAYGQTDQRFFLEDLTAFKATARYDGKPVAGEAFIVLNFANIDPTTSQDFPVDYANMDMNNLAVTAAQGTATGDTVLTVTNMKDSTHNTLKYKVNYNIGKISVGDKVKGFTDLTSGTTQITAAAGVPIAVVEVDASGAVVSVGTVGSVPKA